MGLACNENNNNNCNVVRNSKSDDEVKGNLLKNK